MMLSTALIAELSAFAEANGLPWISGDFDAVLDAPPEYEDAASIGVTIGWGGKHLVTFQSPLDDVLRAAYCVDGKTVSHILMGPAVSDEERQVVLDGIWSEVTGVEAE